VGRDLKGRASPFFYVGGIGLSSSHHGWGSCSTRSWR